MREKLLRRHFFRQFVDNDLIGPGADRHEVLSVLLALLLTSTLFVTFFTAVFAIDALFFFIAASMLVMGLTAALCWDTLALDSRDLAVLGPLPVPYEIVRRAKFQAVLMLAGLVAVAVNVIPSVFYPLLAAGRSPIGVIDIGTLMLVQAAVTVIAGAFGFATVLGVREMCRLILGRNLFRRVSVMLQGGLIVAVAIPLLLLPMWSLNVARQWMASTADFIPPLWFLGLHQTLVGRLVHGRHIGTFQTLAGRAIVFSIGVIVCAVAAYVWNSRRPPTLFRDSGRRRRSDLGGWVARHLIARRPESQAGFFFALQVLRRSAAHRLSIVTSFAMALAGAVMMTAGIAIRPLSDVSSAPIGLFAVQLLWLGVVLLGFCHAVRIPAEFRAKWAFQLAWSGNARAYIAGVKRAALVALGIPVLLAILPLYIFVLGPLPALAHLASGFLIALLSLEVMFLRLDKLPFACNFLPQGNLTALAGVYIAEFLLAVYAIAWFERLALSSVIGTEVYAGVLLVTLAGSKLSTYWKRSISPAIDFDELPAPPTQRLTLSD